MKLRPVTFPPYRNTVHAHLSNWRLNVLQIHAFGMYPVRNKVDSHSYNLSEHNIVVIV